VEAQTAEVDADACSGCRICQDVCPYGAISFLADRKVAEVNGGLCKGCGTCVATCPSGAIRGKGFTDAQVLSQIDALFA